MSEAPEQWAFLSTGWRVAYTWAGCREGASKIFNDTVAEVLHHPGDGDLRTTITLFYTVLRKRALRYPARCELTGLAANLHGQPEPGRSAWTLLLLEALPSEDVEQILGLDQRRLAEAVQKSQDLLKADPTIETGPLLHELDLGPKGEKDVEEAARAMADKHDGQWISVRNPALIAVALGFLLMIGVLTWYFLGQAGTFPDDAMQVATLGALASPEQFDAVDSTTSQLQDWFMLKGFDNFHPAPGFEKYHAVGVRIFKYENEPIAQVLIPENTMFFYSFAAEPLGINVTPEKTWRIAELGRSVVAIREEKGVCFLISFRGKKEQMEQLLEKASKTP